MIIEFTKKAWEKINTYIELADGEISGLAVSTLNSTRNKLIVRDIRIWEQECTSAWTEVVDNDKMLELVTELTGEGVPMEDINIWWHSHADIPSAFSTRDDETIDGWANQRFLAAIIGNKKGEFVGKIAVKYPIPFTIEEEDVTIQVEQEPVNETIKNNIKKEIKEKVKEKKVTTYKHDYSGYQTRIDTEIPKEKKEKVERNYLDYQEIVAHLDGKGKTDYLKWCARECGCNECADWLIRKKKKFPFKSHIFDTEIGLWITEEEYDKQWMDWPGKKYIEEAVDKVKYGVTC